MISIESLSIRQFRGIRELDLTLSGKNFGIYGPNGTGKSGVVDAIEFCLTGDITRLSGPGTDDLSVAKHAPHVDFEKEPEKATVTITGKLSGFDKPVTIRRSVKSPKARITPDDPKVKEAVAAIELHPELALSRREIVKYIITPAGKRATDVQTLLRLDKLDKIRRALTAAYNEAKDEAVSTANGVMEARKELQSGLRLEELTPDANLAIVNEKRALLGLAALTGLDSATSLKEGVAGKAYEVPAPILVKATASREVADLLADANIEGPEAKAARNGAHTALDDLSENMAQFKAMQQSALVKAGLELVSADACPLCDAEWDEAELRAHLETKLQSAAAATKAIENVAIELQRVQTSLQERASAFGKIAEYAKTLKLEQPFVALTEEFERLRYAYKLLQYALNDGAALSSAKACLSGQPTISPQLALKALAEVREAVAALPERSQEEEAREFLLLAEERFRVSASRKLKANRASQRQKIAERVRDLFNEAAKTTLTEIYDAVSKNFESYYRLLNKGDEDAFAGALTAAPARLSLNVDFYGRGKFPPGAYHSEGHQDAMGICLYLALMKQTMGEEFSFCVLDDVLMSVDTGHLRQVCRLLTTEFPKVQFVLTTHDRVWLQFMKSEKLIERAQTFGGWSVEAGPIVFQHHDSWKEIEDALGASDIALAGSRLRRYLEYVGHILCDGIRAPVQFRGDGRYMLDDLLPPGLKQAKVHMKAAKGAAISWGKADRSAEIEADIESFAAAVSDSQAERWAINPSVHYTEWENFEAGEFRKVIKAFEKAIAHLRCPICDTFLHLSYGKTEAEAMRCQCGAKQYDLTAKKGAKQ